MKPRSLQRPGLCALGRVQQSRIRFCVQYAPNAHQSAPYEPFGPAARPIAGCEVNLRETRREPMSRKVILAIAAVAALGMSTLVATDASARFGGGGGGGHGGGHVGG